MLKIITSPQPEILRWAADRQKFKGPWEHDAQAMAAVDEAPDGSRRFRAAVVATDWKRHECHLHIASDGSRAFARRDLIRVLFRWLFEIKGLRRVTAETQIHNISTQILCLKLGFVFEGRRDSGAVDGSDAIVMGMTAENCRWIEDKET